jgi:hypothetical protein
VIADRKALSVKIEGDDAVIAFEGDTADHVSVGDAQLLLDASGKLVGVDLGGGGFDRVAIMLGAHESVTQTRAARVTVTGNVVRIANARGLVR